MGGFVCLPNRGLGQGSVDLVISNCVVNLATDKLSVLRGVHNVLRNGGEFYFSDVFADRRIPDGGLLGGIPCVPLRRIRLPFSKGVVNHPGLQRSAATIPCTESAWVELSTRMISMLCA